MEKCFQGVYSLVKETSYNILWDVHLVEKLPQSCTIYREYTGKLERQASGKHFCTARPYEQTLLDR